MFCAGASLRKSRRFGGRLTAGFRASDFVQLHSEVPQDRRLELLRLAIPRRVYSDNHIRVIAAACRNTYERRAEITTGYRITFEAPILRHFTVELDKI